MMGTHTIVKLPAHRTTVDTSTHGGARAPSFTSPTTTRTKHLKRMGSGWNCVARNVLFQGERVVLQHFRGAANFPWWWATHDTVLNFTPSILFQLVWYWLLAAMRRMTTNALVSVHTRDRDMFLICKGFRRIIRTSGSSSQVEASVEVEIKLDPLIIVEQGWRSFTIYIESCELLRALNHGALFTKIEMSVESFALRLLGIMELPSHGIHLRCNVEGCHHASSTWRRDQE